jgi:hypothetical protein
LAFPRQVVREVNRRAFSDREFVSVCTFYQLMY